MTLLGCCPWWGLWWGAVEAGTAKEWQAAGRVLQGLLGLSVLRGAYGEGRGMEQGSVGISRHSGQCMTCSCSSTAPTPLLEPPPHAERDQGEGCAHRRSGSAL